MTGDNLNAISVEEYAHSVGKTPIALPVGTRILSREETVKAVSAKSRICERGNSDEHRQGKGGDT